MEVDGKRNLVWTKVALSNTRKVHKFYVKTANKEIADKIVDEIFTSVKTLEYAGFIGQTEELLKPLKKEHRYLISNHCKIIYWVNNDKIIISHVFDTRQNPKKLK